MISTMSELFVKIQTLLEGEDVSVSSLNVNTLRLIVEMVENRIYKDVRSRYNEKAFSGVTTTSNAATLPADFEAASIVHFGGKALEPVSDEWLQAYLDAGASGEARYFSRSGGTFRFGPAVTDGTAVQGRYFYRYPALTDANIASNQLLQNETPLFLYGCLVEAIPFFAGKPQSAQLWVASYERTKDRVNADTQYAAFSTGRMIRRPSVVGTF